MSKSGKPLISVVLPTYNSAQYLKRALSSVFEQTYTNWELIIVDNYSTDNTAQIVSTFNDPRVKYLKIKNEGIIAVSRNVGIKTAKGKWIAFLDSDDWWLPEKLECCLDNINLEVDLLYHDLEIRTADQKQGTKKILKSWQVQSPVLIDLLLNGNAISNSSVMVKKHYLEKIGGINECRRIIGAEDYSAWLKIAFYTDNFLYLKKILGCYLIHANSVTQVQNSNLSGKEASNEFKYLLNEKQKSQFDARWKYADSRMKFKQKKINDQLWLDLKYVVKHGKFIHAIKSIYMMANIKINKVL